MQHPSDSTPHAAVAGTPEQHRGRRSLWMLAALAIAFGPLLARVLFDETLATLTTNLVNALGLAEDRPAIHLMRLVVRFGLPVCVALALLRFTGLGQWLALTPLSLALLLVADGLLLLNVVDQLRLYVSSGYPAYRFTGDVAAAVAMAALGLAAASLALATAWYRSGASRQRLTRAGRRWLGEA